MEYYALKSGGSVFPPCFQDKYRKVRLCGRLSASSVCTLVATKAITSLMESEKRDCRIIQDNTERPHQGKRCQGRTPMQTCLDNLPLAKDKMWSNNREAPDSNDLD